MRKFLKIVLLLIVCAAVGFGVLYFTESKKNEKDPDVTTVALMGDIYYDKNFIKWAENNVFEDYFEQIQPLLNSDITVGNLVQTIAEEDEEGNRSIFPNSYLEAIAQAYPDLGFDFFTCANAQSRKKGMAAITHTNEVLDEVKVGHTGIFSSVDEQDTVSIIRKNGVKVAVLSYTTILYDSDEEYEDEECTYDVNMIFDKDGHFDTTHKKQIKRDVTYAKGKADVVVVAVNWGNEYSYDITPEQIIVTNYLNSLGVDVIVGDHPHMAQRADILTNAKGEQTYVFYSLGSLVAARVAPPGQAVNEVGVNMAQTSSVVCFDIVNQEGDVHIDNMRVVPVVNHYEKGYNGFRIIPLSEYTDSLARKHAQSQYTNSFSRNWLIEQYRGLYDAADLLSLEKVNVEE